VLTGWGAYVAAQAVILKPADAMDIGTFSWASSTREEQMKARPVQHLLNQSKAIAFGTALQLIAALLPPIVDVARWII
jgi:hypothetical protein